MQSWLDTLWTPFCIWTPTIVHFRHINEKFDTIGSFSYCICVKKNMSAGCGEKVQTLRKHFTRKSLHRNGLPCSRLLTFRSNELGSALIME
jgi:hypothetical protein